MSDRWNGPVTGNFRERLAADHTRDAAQTATAPQTAAAVPEPNNARTLAYRMGVPEALAEIILNLQRRVAALEKVKE